MPLSGICFPQLSLRFPHLPIHPNSYYFSLSQKEKNIQKSRVHFVLAKYSEVQGLFWSVFGTSIEAPLEKTDFLFAGRYRLHIASWLKAGPHVHFPSQRWDHIWLESVKVCACVHSVCEIICTLVLLGRCCFVGVIHNL